MRSLSIPLPDRAEPDPAEDARFLFRIPAPAAPPLPERDSTIGGGLRGIGAGWFTAERPR